MSNDVRIEVYVQSKENFPTEEPGAASRLAGLWPESAYQPDGAAKSAA